jgi:hypothetical protein
MAATATAAAAAIQKQSRAYAVIHVPPRGDAQVVGVARDSAGVVLPGAARDAPEQRFEFDGVVRERADDGRAGEEAVADTAVAEACAGHNVAVLSVGEEGGLGWVMGREGNRSRTGLLRHTTLRAMAAVVSLRRSAATATKAKLLTF